MKKWIACLLAVTLLVGLLAGCNAGDRGSDSTSGQTNSVHKVDLSQGIKVTDQPATVVCTLALNELGGSAVIEGFKKKYPNITVKLEPMANGDSKLLAMIAAGNGPDLIRCSAFEELPSMVNRGLLLPLDDFVKASGKVDTGDLLEVNNLFRFDGKERGKGPLYGVVKDWSFDNTLWVNKTVFQQAGEPLPSTTEPMTYDELARLCKKLSVKRGETVERFGLITHMSVITLVEAMLASSGRSIWNEDFSASTLQTPETKKAINYWADLQKSGAMASTLFPSTDMTGNGAIAEDKTAMVMGGYWLLSSFIGAQDDVKDKLMLIPSPIAAGGKTVNASLSAIGLGIFTDTKAPMEAYALWEYLMFDEISTGARATSGWGIPALRSMVEKMPTVSALDQQARQVCVNQMEDFSVAPRSNPYVLYTGLTTEFDKYYNLYLYDVQTLDEAMATIDKDIGFLIDEGREMAVS